MEKKNIFIKNEGFIINQIKGIKFKWKNKINILSLLFQQIFFNFTSTKKKRSERVRKTLS